MAETRISVAASLYEQFSRLTRELRNLRLPRGMTPERLSALSAIYRRGPISITALADHEMVRPPSISRMVSALVNAGLVKRSGERHDGRGVLVTTTAKGRQFYQRARERRLRHFAEALERLDDQELLAIEALTTQLERFTLMLDGKR